MLKHRVDFADVLIALEDENALTIEHKFHDEQRFKTPGLGPNLNVLLLVHAAVSNDTIRIVSARKADQSQLRQYYQGVNHD